MVSALFGLWIVSGEGADAGILSFSDSALLCRSWSINSSSASLAITAVWSLPMTPFSVLRMDLSLLNAWQIYGIVPFATRQRKFRNNKYHIVK